MRRSSGEVIGKFREISGNFAAAGDRANLPWHGAEFNDFKANLDSAAGL